jgi:hypothetical protein
MSVELELTSLRLALWVEELNSTDIPQRINALLALEEQRSFSLENIKKRRQFVKKCNTPRSNPNCKCTSTL